MHLNRSYSRNECWAISYRGNLLTRGYNTNNSAEAALSPQGQDLAEDQALLMSCQAGQTGAPCKHQAAVAKPPVPCGDGDGPLLMSCPAGQTGAPCKNQAAGAKIYNCTTNSFLPTPAESRA